MSCLQPTTACMSHEYAARRVRIRAHRLGVQTPARTRASAHGNRPVGGEARTGLWTARAATAQAQIDLVRRILPVGRKRRIRGAAGIHQRDHDESDFVLPLELSLRTA